MENYTYLCEYCSKEYVPRRRKVQKYCSTTCRVKAYYFRHKHKHALPAKQNTVLSNPTEDKTDQKTSIDKISLSGVGNAALANVATDVLKNFLTKEDNKPATKGDLKTLMVNLKERYIKINNIPPSQDGSQAFFDNIEKKVVYLKMKPRWS